jgi:hypothetical protein
MRLPILTILADNVNLDGNKSVALSGGKLTLESCKLHENL